MEITVTFDKDELEKMLKDLLKRQGLRLSESSDNPIAWKTKGGFRVVVKAEVDPSAATQAIQPRKVQPISALDDAGEDDDDITLDPSMFPNGAGAAALQKSAENELASQIPKIPGETSKRQQDTTKKRTKKKPTRKDRGPGR